MLILCCLIAPEFLVFRAVIERSKVSQIRSRWNSRISQIAEQTLEKLPSKQAFVLLYLDDWMRRKVSTKQAFVLLYCGMLITWEENDQTFYVDFDKLNRHLGDVGPRLLKIYSDCIPSDDEIDARGKANPLTKIVTCSQIFWVSVQVLGRLAEHMTVSLPEVVTVGFTSLTLVSICSCFPSFHLHRRTFAAVSLPTVGEELAQRPHHKFPLRSYHHVPKFLFLLWTPMAKLGSG